MSEKKRNPALRCLGIIGAFWALIVFGPALVMFMNKITVWFSGMGVLEGSFGHNLLSFFSQTMACVFACGTAEQISDNEHNVCVLVNEIVAICIVLLSALCSLFLLGDIWQGVSSILAAAILVFFSVRTAKSINTKPE
jgi:hypothetical protein